MINSYNLAETKSGLSNEGSLHSSVKLWYSKPGDRFEVRLHGSIADILRDNLIIEIQTRNFLAIRNKLLKLSKIQPVRLVYPVSVEKWITHIKEPGGEILSSRRSPKKGSAINIFDELIRIPELINEENLSIEVLLIISEEIRCQDGKGSWRRKGVSIVDKKLKEVVGRVEFRNKLDFLCFIPGDISQPFTNKSLAEKLGCSVSSAGKITYCLKKMGSINEVGKKGNQLLFNMQTNAHKCCI